jgi:uncharacterized membrane protein YidH (DUF202 family)
MAYLRDPRVFLAAERTLLAWNCTVPSLMLAVYMALSS